MPADKDKQDQADPEKQVVQVDTTRMTTGSIKFFGDPKLSTPTILARCTKALRYFCVSLITMISGSNMFSGNQSKMINFGLSVFILFLGCVDIVVGVEPDKKNAATALLLMLAIYYFFSNVSIPLAFA